MEGFRVIDIIQQLGWMVRILFAGLCGGVIGYERESRKKTAGLRTHVIVAVSAALLIVLSKYGFQDVVGPFVRVDPSRIASGTVAAIGFLGSGVIFSRNKNVSGVTTSAGIWATLGVGMAVGAGMYVIGICTTVIVVLVEIFLGRQGKISHIIKDVYEIEVEYNCIIGTEIRIDERIKTKETEARIDKLTPKEENQIGKIIKTELEETYKCKILKFRTKRKRDCIQLELLVRTAKGKELFHLAELIEKYPAIRKITI